MSKINKGDWCWFSNDKDHVPILAQFDFVTKEVISPYDIVPYKEMRYKAIGAGYTYKYCEHFIGNLPTIMNQEAKFQISWNT